MAEYSPTFLGVLLDAGTCTPRLELFGWLYGAAHQAHATRVFFFRRVSTPETHS